LFLFVSFVTTFEVRAFQASQRFHALDANSQMKTLDDIARGGGWIGAPSGRHRVMSLWTFAAIVTLLACIHLGFWALRKPDTAAASVDDKLPSVSYNRFAEPSPDGLRIPEAQIRADLAVIAKHAKAVRTFDARPGTRSGDRG